MKKSKQKAELRIANAGVPQSLVTLWAIVDPKVAESEDVPTAVSELATKIREWMECNKARTTMNRSFATLRTRGEKIEEIIRWLNDAVTSQVFIKSGGYGAHAELCVALNSILSGEKAHAAFGQNQNKGRPRSPGFSRAHDAALYAEYLTRLKGHTFKDATFVASETFDAREDSVELERRKLAGIDDLSIKEMALDSCRKHSITP
ncbi:MAG: hypothetical protein ABS69_06935 [Nitrosomonadales bacterium SCN 54-20]|nr:MAG: hypothetical protein ABS69_06935 [Nitrosomonadales bacterium SCN 54-20]